MSVKKKETTKKEDVQSVSFVPVDSRSWHEKIKQTLDSIDGFQQSSQDMSALIHEKILEQGEDARKVADVIHGKQLGHPLHPVLTDITISSWVLGLAFDIAGYITRFRPLGQAGDYLTIIGTFTAIPTALAGILDYSTIKKEASHYGAAHGILNGVALYFYFLSVKSRLTGSRFLAIFFSFSGLIFATAGSWLGGELVYRHKVGVNHTPESELDEWTSTISLSELPDNEPKGVEVKGESILLFRQGDKVTAISAVCSHAGGPLDEGEVVDNVCIQCPWHQSVFDMQTGDVVHSPATIGQVRYAVRLNEDTIEVKRYIAEEMIETE